MAEKKIVLYEDDAVHARFRIQLKYDELSQPKFFKMMIDSYINQDPMLMSFIYKKIENTKSERKKKKIEKDVKEAKKIAEEFALDENEIKNIFDLIATENPDL
jgi:hypothetical protein